MASADESRITPATLEITEQPGLAAGFMPYQRDRRPADFLGLGVQRRRQAPVINLHACTE